MNESEEHAAQTEPKEFLTLKSAAKLLDATVLVVVLTGSLYFWGYIYYAVVTETLGAPYHGVSLPVQDYLVASWQGVIYMLLLVIVGLWILYGVDLGAFTFANWLRKKIPRKEESRKGQWIEPPYLQLALALVTAVAVLWGGVMIVLPQAKKEANNILKAQIETIIRGADGHPIEGRFIYLRDFGSALLVREMSADMKHVVGSRWFKEGSYTGFTLLETNAQPAVINEPSGK